MSNVWIAEVESRDETLRLNSLRRVQKLPGDDAPFRRLADLLRNGEFAAAGIDAPFSLPVSRLAGRGHAQLLRTVDAMPLEGRRPFPAASQIVEAFLPEHAPRGRKEYRTTEADWRGRGVNARSTTWAGARGGAPMTIACLKLLAAIGGPIWPWVSDTSTRLIVEAFPAAQLRHWHLPHEGYNGAAESATQARKTILHQLDRLVTIIEPYLSFARESADALDAVLCAFAARAVVDGRVAYRPSEVSASEGWIAVHE